VASIVVHLIKAQQGKKPVDPCREIFRELFGDRLVLKAAMLEDSESEAAIKRKTTLQSPSSDRHRRFPW